MANNYKLDLPANFRVWRALVGRVESLHERGLIHRDLKPGNFILVPKKYSDVSVLAQTPTPRAQFVYRLVDSHNDKPSQSNAQEPSSSSQCCMIDDVGGVGSASTEPLLAQENVRAGVSSACAPCKPAGHDAADLEVLVQHPTSKRIVVIPLNIKVSDFGTGQRLNNVEQGEQGEGQHVSHLSVFGLTGTGVYMPPEVVRQTPDRRKRLCKRADVWALGIMLSQMLYEGKTPFHVFQGIRGGREAVLAVASETVNNEVIPKQFAEGRKKLWEVERRRVLADPLRLLREYWAGGAEGGTVLGEVLRSLVEAWIRLELLFRLGECSLAFSVEDRLDCADLTKLMDRAAATGWGVWAGQGPRGIDGPTGDDGGNRLAGQACLEGDARPRADDGVVPDSEFSQLAAVLEGIMGRGGEDGGAEDVGTEGVLMQNTGWEGSAGREGNAGREGEGSAGREGNAGREGTTIMEATNYSVLDMEVARIGDRIGARLFPEVWVSRASAAASVAVRISGGKSVDRKTVRGPFFGLFDTRCGQVLALIILIVIVGSVCGGLIAAFMGNRSWSDTKERDVVVGPTSGTSGPETSHVSVFPFVKTTTPAVEPSPSMGQGGGGLPAVPHPTVSPPNRNPGFLEGGGKGNGKGGTGGVGGTGGSAPTRADRGTGSNVGTGPADPLHTVSPPNRDPVDLPSSPPFQEKESGAGARVDGGTGDSARTGGVGGSGGSAGARVDGGTGDSARTGGDGGTGGSAPTRADRGTGSNVGTGPADPLHTVPPPNRNPVPDTDKDATLAAGRQSGLALGHAHISVDVQADREVALAAVRQHGQALAYVSADLQADREIVLEAVGQWFRAFAHASPDLKADRVFVREAMKQDFRVFAYASISLKNDRDFVLEAVRQNGFALVSASVDLKADRGVVLAAVRQNGLALVHASVDLQADRDFVREAMKQDAPAHASAERTPPPSARSYVWPVWPLNSRFPK